MIEDQPRISRKALVYGFAFSIVLWIPILWLFGCIGSRPAPRPAPRPEPPAPPALFAVAKEATAEQVTAPPLMPAMRALIGLNDEFSHPLVRRLIPKTACEASIPLPYIIPAARGPRVGEPWECLFVTTACPTPPEPDWFAWVIASTREPDKSLPINLDSIGMQGCQLLVNLDQIISVPPGLETLPGSLMTRTPGQGQIRLRWTPEPGMAGQKLWLQLLVHAPKRSPSGFLVSYALELTVGS